MVQTLSSRRQRRRELSVLLAQSATPATLSPAPCASCWPNRGRSGVMVPYYPRHSTIEIRPNNNPTMDSRCSSERKSHMSLTLNQKLQMIQLREEDMLKDIPLVPVSQVVNSKETFLKEIKSAIPVNK
ncbi:hypothetical protein QTO34_005591 [Cnephaeus nilssonii]|uniref:HTH psq-type domain-containing protein n=1 Tax=Cnephaeus nilssonii TaxID=3371016 RepID=A0AA40HNL8_CNENI|nr:hypothetical protein QTO34_005591 [Eptesicus nilssonii]